MDRRRQSRITAINLSWLQSLEGRTDRLEPVWRASQLASDRRRCIAVVLVVALLAATRGGFGVLEVLTGDAAGSDAPSFLSMVPSLLALLFVVLLNRAASAAALDWVMASAVALFVLGLLLERGADTPVDVVSALTVVALIWTLLPQPLPVRLLLALLLSVPISVQLLVHASGQAGPDTQRLTADLLVLATVNVFAGWLSVRVHAAQRVHFRFLEVSGRLRDRAERMRKLLPVCAWCGRLRDEAGYWRALNEFIADGDLDAVATAQCDACRAKAGTTVVPATDLERVAAEPVQATPAVAAPDLLRVRQRLAPLIVAVMFVSLAFMAQELWQTGPAALESMPFRLRAISVLMSIVVLIFALRSERRPWLDLVLTGWALWISLLMLYFMISGEAHVVPSLVALAMVSIAFGLPVPAPLRAIPAMLLLGGGLWLVLLPPDGAFEPSAPRIAAALLISFCVALWFSVEAERHQRALQAAELEVISQRRVTNRLGALLPVCRTCRSVRSGDGYWRDVRSHLQLAADRRATHGICERCLRVELDRSGM